MLALQTRTHQILEPAEAFAAVTLSAIASDGYLADEEMDSLLNTLNRMSLFKSYPGDALRRMLERLFGILRREGLASLLSAGKRSLPHELQEPAFAIATDLLLADGILSDKERHFLNQLQQTLAIPEETALKILDVMTIKNCG
jgi:hypothetical protein